MLYEYPFNEHVRTCLRLEHLFRLLGQLVGRDDAVDHHYALATIFEVIEVAARADLKSELLKDLERHKQLYASYRGNPAIAEAVLDKVIGQMDACYQSLQSQAGKPGQSLADIEWLHSLRTRIAIPGGTCEFDAPVYHAWQHRDAAARRRDLTQWAATLGPLAESVYALLKLMRDSGAPQKVLAAGGKFQQSLPAARTFQLARLVIDPSWGLVPEISGNRMMILVRMMRLDDAGKLQSDSGDTPFELALCA